MMAGRCGPIRAIFLYVIVSIVKLLYRSFQRDRFGEGLPGNELEELFGTHFETSGELDDAVKLHVRFGTLHAADVIPVDATKLRELLLREFAVLTQYAKLSAEQNQSAGHALIGSFGIPLKSTPYTVTPCTVYDVGLHVYGSKYTRTPVCDLFYPG